MLRRWLIRSFFIGLIVFCMAAWVVSYWQCVYVQHRSQYYNCSSGVESGSIWFTKYARQGLPDETFWGWNHYPARAHILAGQYHFTGFYILLYQPDISSSGWTLFVPFWFSILLFMLILWFAWTKTRAKPQGFPIEPAFKESPSTGHGPLTTDHHPNDANLLPPAHPTVIRENQISYH